MDNNGGGQANSAPALVWSEAEPQKDDYTNGVNFDNPQTREIECGVGEVLRDVTCYSDARSGGSDAEGDKIQRCDGRTRNSAFISPGAGSSSGSFAEPIGISGTCVPIKGVKNAVFNDQDSYNTFEVPPGSSKVTYKIHGGRGGGPGDTNIDPRQVPGRSDGGYVSGSIPVDGATTLKVYVGEDGGNGERSPDTDNGVGAGGQGGCVPFNGGICGGDGGNGESVPLLRAPPEQTTGGGGGGAPTIITDSSGSILAAAGGGGGSAIDSGGGGGAGGGNGGVSKFDEGADVGGTNPGEDADTTTKNLGGNGGERGISELSGEDGGTFVRSTLPIQSTGTSDKGAQAELSAIP